jgi:hypothetical protein
MEVGLGPNEGCSAKGKKKYNNNKQLWHVYEAWILSERYIKILGVTWMFSQLLLDIYPRITNEM